MKFKNLVIENLRGFKGQHVIELSDNINVFIGRNNSGKSTILLSLYNLQKSGTLFHNDITFGNDKGSCRVRVDAQNYRMYRNDIEATPTEFSYSIFSRSRFGIIYNYSSTDGIFTEYDTNELQTNRRNFIYPYLSKRKVKSYSQQINKANSNTISDDFQYLYSKIDNIQNSANSNIRNTFLELCNKVLGFELGMNQDEIGKQVIYFIDDNYNIPLPFMGEGVANILGLLVDIAHSNGKVFIIEEPENDIHPQALKALMEIIIENSNKNQFFISTHSNIVMRMLGAKEGAKIFRVHNDMFDATLTPMRLSKCDELNTAEDRRSALEELGYEFFDFGLWEGWLILEESSAQTIIEYLIKWFIPKLSNKLKVVSAGGVDNVKKRFNTMKEMFLFLHLEEMYKNRAWVIIDSGAKENGIIQDFKKAYLGAGWKEDSFLQFSEHDFESYYPDNFNSDRKSALAITDEAKKRAAKKDLLLRVKDWIDKNEELAKSEFNKSASEIIDILRFIEQKLFNSSN
ncbi:ATP-dependent nuclease [Arsenicibacter rosenii]|uniref:ATPase AAA-type core domain-containing protein n=1 Tax=Arsenicibacter rosenii TaxID=1750698 RepID=A0A1S2VTB6_9BACT|nr:ATP-binding protein [Arsenicibacter rosenii]OIN61158.1 hypothetical protein BLX24_03610 [Arsenicibacter rosenii]